ncbi:hypothetical protein SDJN03_00617, partial [Cucurbita argyrosperma subsp. sororia]
MSRESPLSSASGVLAAMFPSPQKVGSRTSSSGDWLKQTNGNQPRHTKQGNSGGSLEPCHLSSSLYYGGQDGYCEAPSERESKTECSSVVANSLMTQLKKSGGEDDPNGNNSQPASRGNWWQGSLYY